MPVRPDEITFTEQDDRVLLEMSRDDWELLLLCLGVAGGARSREKRAGDFWACIAFVNRLNRTNPRFTPYEIPEEHAHPS